MRIPGILQRIGVVYCAVALIALRTPIRAQIAIAGGILLSYWAVLTLVPVPGAGVPGWVVFDHPASTLAAWVDRALLDWSAVGWGNHIWAETKTWDPEGPLSTIPAVATAILGLITGRWLASRRPLAERVAGMLAAGAIVAAAGCVWGWVFPIQQEPVDQFLRVADRRTRRHHARRVCLAHRRPRDPALGRAVRGLWGQPPDRIRRLGSRGAPDLLCGDGTDGHGPCTSRVGCVSFALCAVARATHGVPGLRDQFRPRVAGRPDTAVSPANLF